MMRAFLVFALFGCCLAVDRSPRWLRRETHTITRVVKEREIITESTPSSCVVVQTSLPPCRHVRAANIQPTHTTEIKQTASPTLSSSSVDQGWKPVIHPSDPMPHSSLESSKATTPVPVPRPPPSSTASSWFWNMFDFGPKEVYVTKTIKEVFTTKSMDPNTVVTFSVKGCRPSRLPFDLPECDAARQHLPQVAESTEKGVIVMAPIQFVPSIVTPSKTSEVVKEDGKKEEKKVEVPKESEKKQENVKNN